MPPLWSNPDLADAELEVLQHQTLVPTVQRPSTLEVAGGRSGDTSAVPARPLYMCNHPPARARVSRGNWKGWKAGKPY